MVCEFGTPICQRFSLSNKRENNSAMDHPPTKPMMITRTESHLVSQYFYGYTPSFFAYCNMIIEKPDVCHCSSMYNVWIYGLVNSTRSGFPGVSSVPVWAKTRRVRPHIIKGELGVLYIRLAKGEGNCLVREPLKWQEKCEAVNN